MQVERIQEHLGSHASEYLDAHIIVGFTARGQPVISIQAPDVARALALEALVGSILMSHMAHAAAAEAQGEGGPGDTSE